MDRSEVYGIYLLLWLILAQVVSNQIMAVVSGVMAVAYGIASVYQSFKEDKNE
jgi:uncharacterized membrane protein HdeD (DUF308 family)